MLTPLDKRYLAGMVGRSPPSSPPETKPFSGAGHSPRLQPADSPAPVPRPRSPVWTGAVPPSPPPRGAPVVGRALADLPHPSWPPALDFRFLGYGRAGAFAHTADDELYDPAEAFRFDGLDDHEYDAPGPPVGGGGFAFGTDARTGRSRNRRRLPTSSAGLDGGDGAIHPDVDPYAPDDGPGPGEYSPPRWPDPRAHRVGSAAVLGCAPEEGARRPSSARPASPGPAAYRLAREFSPREPAPGHVPARARYSPGAGGVRWGTSELARGRPAFRQPSRRQAELDAHMKNARARHDGAFRGLRPRVRPSWMHGRHELGAVSATW